MKDDKEGMEEIVEYGWKEKEEGDLVRELERSKRMRKPRRRRR